LNDQGQTGSDISIVDDPNSGGHGRFNTVWLTNTIQASHTLGIRVTTGNTLTVNSILWSQTPITISADLSTTIQVSNSHSGDPAFTADGYHLTVGSDAFGQGIPTDVATDIDGESRRPVPDLGADEFQLSLPLHRFHLPLIIKTPQGGFSLVD
jgi:hypothetical protein